MATKLDALRSFASQASRSYLAEEVITSTARSWSRAAAGTDVGAFEVVRSAG